MQLVWLTDIHLNFIDEDARHHFYQSIIDTKCNGVLITGDIAEATDVQSILIEMADFIDKPIYFILGNHDYYRGQVNEVRSRMIALTQSHPHLFWLAASGMMKLNDDVILVGQDGWADGRLGDYQRSRVVLNDSRMIANLFQKKIIGKQALLTKMQELADADAFCLQSQLKKVIATQNPKKIIVLTHVPPFKEVCLHQGKISDDEWLPFFGSKIMGDVLIEIANQNADIDFLVLCGHTHSKGVYQPVSNLMIEAGAAEYCRPEIQTVIFV